MVDPLHFCIMVGPLAVYALLIGWINLCNRPFITTGARDAGALGVAIVGFVIAGPMELFLPEATANTFGYFVWLLLLSFYALSLMLLVLLMRPKLVIYNITPDQLRPVLGSVVANLDKEARWAGDSLLMPALGVQLTMESTRALRTAQLVSAGGKQNFIGWRKLEVSLRQALNESATGRSVYGFFQVGFGLICLTLIGWTMAADRAGVMQSLSELLRTQ